MNPQRRQTENDSSVKGFSKMHRHDDVTGDERDGEHVQCGDIRGCDVCEHEPAVGEREQHVHGDCQGAYGRRDTNSITVLQATNVYAYDLNGNLLYDGRRAFDYDDENQLIRVTVTNGWKSEYTYDGKMRRRIVKEFTWNGSWQQTNEVHFVYDGNLVVQERDTNNLPQVTYTRGTDLSGSMQGAGGIGGLLARTDNSKLLISDPFATAFYHADGNGNITALVYTNQMIAAKYLYDPYGNMLSMYGSLADANAYRFSSKEWNANSGLYYYLYRFFDPTLQRWVNRDPLGDVCFCNWYSAQNSTLKRKLEFGPQEANYTFVGNDPNDFVDKWGLIQQQYADPNCVQNCANQYGNFCLSSGSVGGGIWGFWGMPPGKYPIWRGKITKLGDGIGRSGIGLALGIIFDNIGDAAGFYGCVSGCPTIVHNESPSWPLSPTYY